MTFAYCRLPGRDMPCRKILDCWFETFDVRAFIDEHFTEQEIARILAPRADKVCSLVDLIHQARTRSQGKDQ